MWWVGAGWVGDTPGTVAAPSVRVAEERGGVYENKVHCTLEILASTGRKFHAAGEVCITWPAYNVGRIDVIMYNRAPLTCIGAESR